MRSVINHRNMKRILTVVAALSAIFSVWAQNDDSSALMDKLYPQIMQASQSGDQALAKSLIEQLIDAGVDISELETAYAYSLAATGNLPGAIDRLNAYLAANESDYLACQALGELYAQSGDRNAALAWLGKSSAINPGYARPYVTIARMTAKDDKATSIDTYNKAIALFIEANQPNGAVQLGVEAMEVEPENVELLINLGDALLLAGMADKALAFYNEGIAKAAASQSPDYQAITTANYKIAKIYRDKADYDSALTYLDILIDNEKYTGQYKQTYADALALAAECSDMKSDAERASQYRAKAKDFSAE